MGTERKIRWAFIHRPGTTNTSAWLALGALEAQVLRPKTLLGALQGAGIGRRLKSWFVLKSVGLWAKESSEMGEAEACLQELCEDRCMRNLFEVTGFGRGFVGGT